MKISRGENNFVDLPDFAAKLYDKMMQSGATRLQYREIAQDLVSRMESGRLLDIGTGPGHLLSEIHKLNSRIELHGLDVSKSMLTQAARNLEGIHVALRCSNIKATDYPNGFFDLVTCSGSFYLWDNPVEGLDEIHRLLKPGSAAYLYETHRDIDRKMFWQKMQENLKGENWIKKSISPRLFIKQIGMTYSTGELAAIIEKSRFVSNSQIEEITIVNLPVWVRIKLEKHT